MRIQRRTLVIGLGGTGCFALRFVKANLQKAGILPTEKELEDVNLLTQAVQRLNSAPIRFVPIDLDETSRTKKNTGASIDAEFVRLDQQKVVQKVKYMDLKENQVYWNWYPDKDHKYIRLHEASQGTGQWRVLGRLAYCENQYLIEERISRAILELSGGDYDKRVMDTMDIDVVIVASTAGGTGAGMLLDVAYFLKKGELESDANIRLTTNAFLLLPNVFENWDTGHRTKANTYATLKELRGFYRQEADFDMIYPNRQGRFKVKAGKVIPFSNIFLIDQDLGSKKLTTPEECFHYIGNLVYLRMISSLSGEAHSAFTNMSIPHEISNSEFVFSSCSGAIIILPTIEEIAETLLAWILKQVRTRYEEQEPDASLDLMALEKLYNVFDSTKVDWIWPKHLARINTQLSDFTEAIEERRLIAFYESEEGLFNTNWSDALEQTIKSEADKASDTFVKQLSIRNLRGYCTGTFSVEALARIIDLVIGNLNSCLLDTFEGRIEYLVFNRNVEHYLTQINERSSLIRNFKSRLDLFSDRSSSTEFSNFFSSEIKQNYQRLEEITSELQGIIANTAKQVPLIKYVHTIFLWEIARGLQEKRQSLKENRDHLYKAIEYLYSNNYVFEPAIDLSTEHSSQEPHLMYIVTRPAITDALETEMGSVSSLFQDSLSKIIFDLEEFKSRFRLELWNKNVLHPLQINVEPKIEDVQTDILKEIRKAIENGAIRIGVKDYLDEIESLIDYARTPLFKNLRNNTLEESFVLWSFPQYIKGKRYPFYSKAEADVMKDKVGSLIRNTFTSGKEISRTSEENTFLIYHETHHHPPENIGGIRAFYEDYIRFPFPLSLLHIHKAYDSMFAEILEPDSQPLPQPKHEIEPEREVFISYAWDGESEEIANELDKAFQEKGIIIVRDKRDLGFKGRIKEFMEQLGRGKCVIVVISKEYLVSDNCMFELIQIAQNGDFYERVFPIVLDNTNLDKPIYRVKYIQYWENQIQELNEAMKSLSLANLPGLSKNINLYDEIRRTLDGLIDTLRDMNTLTAEMHRASGFAALIEAVMEKLAE